MPDSDIRPSDTDQEQPKPTLDNSQLFPPEPYSTLVTTDSAQNTSQAPSPPIGSPPRNTSHTLPRPGEHSLDRTTLGRYLKPPQKNYLSSDAKVTLTSRVSAVRKVTACGSTFSGGEFAMVEIASVASSDKESCDERLKEEPGRNGKKSIRRVIEDISVVADRRSSSALEAGFLDFNTPMRRPSVVGIYTDDQDDVKTPNWSQNLVLSLPDTDANTGKRMKGLSSVQALSKLLQVANEVMEEHRRRTRNGKELLRGFLSHPVSLIHLGVILVLLVFYVYGAYASQPYQHHYTGILVETIILILVLAWNAGLYRREKRLVQDEVMDRAKAVVAALGRAGMGVVQDIKIPTVPSVTVGKVVRDGVVRTFPSNLLVEGDIVEMLYGDVAPCKMKYVYVTPPPKPETERKAGPEIELTMSNNKGDSAEESKLRDDRDEQTSGNAKDDNADSPSMASRYIDPRPAFYLTANEVFRPTLFGQPPYHPTISNDLLQNRGRHQFVLLETPLRTSLASSLTPPHPRPRSVLYNQSLVLSRFFHSRVIPSVVLLALLINSLRFIPLYQTALANESSSSIVIILLQAFEVVVVQSLYALITVLPTVVPLGTVWWLSKTYGNAVILVLFEVLQGSKTEFEDEESVDEFDEQAPPPTKNVHLDLGLIYGRFWYLLTKWDNTSLTRSTNLVESLGSTTVICCIDREGTISSPFPSIEQILLPNDNVEDPITVLDVVEDCQSPNGVRFEDRDWEKLLPCLKPLGLNLLLNAHCGVLQGRKRVEMHKKGSRLNVHGRTEAGRQACLCRLGREVGFTDEALKSFVRRKEIYTFAPYLHTAAACASSSSLPSNSPIIRTESTCVGNVPCSSSISSDSSISVSPSTFAHRSHRNDDDYGYEVPSMLSSIYEEANTQTYQLLTDGNVEVVLGFCEDVWDGSGLRELDIGTYKRIYDFYQNALTNDMQCVAYAYRPINIRDGAVIPFFAKEVTSANSLTPATPASRGIVNENTGVNGGSVQPKTSRRRQGDERGAGCEAEDDSFAYIELPPGAKRWWGPGIGIGGGAENRKAKVRWEKAGKGALFDKNQRIEEGVPLANRAVGEEDANTFPMARSEAQLETTSIGEKLTASRESKIFDETVPSAVDGPFLTENEAVVLNGEFITRQSNDVESSETSETFDTENREPEKSDLPSLKEGSIYEYERERNTNDEFSFDEKPISPEVEAEFYRDVLEGQIFLSMAALAYQPKMNVCDFIEDLGLAGIRFVYFSPTSERESKAYAERLGLETDWNTCILLSSADDPHRSGPGYVESHDIKARLPRGIENIRPHLDQVDDIPLHVSLFAECAPEATQEMIRILQENGEVVCCIGSALNHANTAAFAQADIGVSIEPLQTRAHVRRSDPNAGQPPLALGSALTSLPCGLQMHSDTSLYALTQIVREARRLTNSLRMGFAFMIACNLSITFIVLLGSAFLLPPIFQGYHILWLEWIICPLLAISFLFSPHEMDTMKILPVKNQDHLKDLWRFITYWFLRSLLPVLMTVAVYVIALRTFSGDDIGRAFGGYGDNVWPQWTALEQWEVLYSQNCAMVAFVWYIVCSSGTFMSRTRSIREFPPYHNRFWIGAVCVCVLLQVVFSILFLYRGPYSLAMLPGWAIALALLWPVVCIPMNELVKMHDRKEFTRFQKMAKLVFNTKLGMHSPV